jgi:hypothetical protein
LGVVAPRLIQLFLGRRSNLELALLSLQVLSGQYFGVCSLIIVIVSLGQIRGINQCQYLSARDPFSEDNFEFEHPAAQRWQHLRRSRRVRLDHSRQLKTTPGELSLRRAHSESLAQG